MKGNMTERTSTDRCRRWIPSPIGILLLEADESGLTTLYIEEMGNGRESKGAESACGRKDKCSECVQMRILDQAQQELEEYFAGGRQTFETPLHIQGTGFQQRVWKALRQIPYGETRSYADIARMIGNPQACRAVGGANNKNKILLMIPCHRVVGKNGDLTGFAAGITVKEALLEMEREHVRGEERDDKEDGAEKGWII